MDATTTPNTITQHEFEGFWYISYDGTFYKGCKRCYGTGHYSFNGYDSICYLCNNHIEGRLGEAFENEAAAQKWCHQRAVRKAQADRKRENERLKLVAKRDAKAEALKAEHPDVYAFLMGIEIGTGRDDETYEQWAARQETVKIERDDFVKAMAENLLFVSNCDKPFTPRMIEVLRDKMAKRVEKAVEAAAHPVPAGRQVVTGEIIGTKVVEGDYGTAYKITVKDDRGFRIYVSLPKAQADEAYDTFLAWTQERQTHEGMYGYAVWFSGTEDIYTGVKGRRITFTATLEQSGDDPSFGFGSRPTKGSWL
jgi:hypothetical protein